MTILIVPITKYSNSKRNGLISINALFKNYNLYFSKHEVLGNKIIGLDHIKRKLLFFKQGKQRSSCCLIDLKDVESCSVKKVYQNIEAGALNKRRLEEFLTTIALKLGFKNGRKALVLPFYEVASNSFDAVMELDAKAKAWRELLVKTLTLTVGTRA